MENKGFFIVLEGVDGCGKTTLCKKLVDIVNSPDFIHCSRKTIISDDPFIEEQMKKVSSLMWTANNGELDHFMPKHYSIHLQAVWYSLLIDYVVKPLLEQNKTVIVDGWIYKFIARLLQQNFRYDYLKTVFSHIPEPDLVLLLNVDIELIWERKTDFKLYELGTHLGHTNPNKNSFLEFQSKTWHHLQNFSKREDWSIVQLLTSDIKHNAQLLLCHIQEAVPFVR